MCICTTTHCGSFSIFRNARSEAARTVFMLAERGSASAIFPQNHDSRSFPFSHPSYFMFTKFTVGTNPDAPAPPQDQGISIEVENPLAGQNDTNEPERWKPVQYFFYGTLTNEQVLTDVLCLKYPPVLRPASIAGYSMKMWGPYPTLVDGPPENVVNGMAYEVDKQEHEGRLADYETKAYRCATCLIKPASGGDHIVGKTFVWAKKPNDRALRPGNFDIEAWRK